VSGLVTEALRRRRMRGLAPFTVMSCVDRITPATTDTDRAEVRDRFGIDDQRPVVCELLPANRAHLRPI
jgi:mannitol 2-dehydrogenase